MPPRRRRPSSRTTNTNVNAPGNFGRFNRGANPPRNPDRSAGQTPAQQMGGAAGAVQGAAGVSSSQGQGGQPGGMIGGVYTPPPEAPGAAEPPPYDPPEGYEWVQDPETGEWSIQPIEGEDDDEGNDLFARLNNILRFWGLDQHPEAAPFLQQALAEGWSVDEFRENLRSSSLYLSNPLFAANVERARSGKGFMDEAQVIAYGAEVKRLARQFGYTEPSDNYVAMGLLSGKSLAEFEHVLNIQKQINEFGGGVRWAAENIMGLNLSDDDLFEIFDPERDTAEFDRAYQDALYRGRPVALGLGVRSQAEADAFRALGVDPNEAFRRMESLAGNASRFQRLGAIEDLITQGLPDDWNPDLSTTNNSTLVRAILFNRPDAQAELDQVIAREIARFKQGGGAVATQTGQQLGLLNQEQRATYG